MAVLLSRCFVVTQLWILKRKKNIYDQSKTKLRLAILAGVIRAMRISIKLLGSLSKDADCDGNENVKKKNRFGLAKHQLWTCFTLFYTFLCRRCTTSTWNWEYISPFCGYRECKTTIFVFFFWTSIRSFSIPLQLSSPTFVKFNAME